MATEFKNIGTASSWIIKWLSAIENKLVKTTNLEKIFTFKLPKRYKN